jgi:hypothetical protein
MLQKASRRTIILIAFFGLTWPAMAVEQEPPPFDGLMTTAHAVVAVEILSTDYTATPADGPMVAVAKVLKVLKGPFTQGERFRFTETAWVGPTYQKGEYRILFLEKATAAETLRAKPWRILSHLDAKGDFFVEKDAIPDLSLETLESFLKRIQGSGTRPKKIVFGKSTVQ